MSHHWCWGRVCRGCNRTAKTFDLVKIRAKPLKIWAKSLEIWAKCVITFTRLLYVVWIYKNGSQNESADLVLFLIIWRSCFLGKLGEIWSSLAEIWAKMFACSRLIWQNAPNMKWNAVVFFGGHFLDFFQTSWGNLGKNPSHPEKFQKFACCCTCVPHKQISKPIPSGHERWKQFYTRAHRKNFVTFRLANRKV